MAYKSETVAVTIKRLNSQFFLPAIQREFVWSPDQICQLFDSIMRGYPISSFLYWQLDENNRDKWEAYKFIDHAEHGGTHNVIAHTDGVHDLTLILDGQQRFTSLLVGLKGAYTVKKKHKRKNNPNAYSKQFLYLNLFKDPKLDEDDDNNELRYDFCFFESQPSESDKKYWYKVGRILDFDSKDDFDDYVDNLEEELPDSVSKRQIKVFKNNLSRLRKVVHEDEVIAYYTELDQDYDRVLDIFIRANEGGTKLSKSDLLLSMVISKWEGVNAREEIFGFVDRLNKDLTRKNDFHKDFIMKACLVLTDLPVAYKVKNFTNNNLALIQSRWEDIKNAIEKSVDLINIFGIDEDTLTSANTLIPIIYYFFKKPDIDFRRSTTPFAIHTSAEIRRWLSIALLNNVFSGQSDNMLRDVRKAVQDNLHRDDFPADKINETISKSGRTAYFDDYAIDSFLELTYHKPVTFLALSLLYEENAWGTMQFHKDHIFPQDTFKGKNLEDRGFDSDVCLKFVNLKDNIGNLTLLLERENIEKRNKPFEDWIKTRDESFLDKHLIPKDKELWKLENFESFIDARNELIKNRLIQLFGKQVKIEQIRELEDLFKTRKSSAKKKIATKTKTKTERSLKGFFSTGKTGIDEAYWKKKATWTLATARELLALVGEIFESPSLYYVETYIRITVAGNKCFALEDRKSNKSDLSFYISDDHVAEVEKLLLEQNIRFAKRQRGKKQRERFDFTVDKDFIKEHAGLLTQIAEYVIHTWKK